MCLQRHQHIRQSQRPFISRHLLFRMDAVVDDVVVAVEEEVDGAAAEDKAMLRRPRYHRPMD